MNKGYTDNEILVKTLATLDSYVKSLWGDPFNVSKCMKATLGQAKRYWREGKGYTLSTSLTPDDVMEMAEMLERLEPQIKESVVKLWEKIQAAEIEKKKRETIKAMKQVTFRELLKVEMEKWGVKYSPIWQGYRVKVGLRLNNNYIMSFIVKYREFENGEYIRVIGKMQLLAQELEKTGAEVTVLSPRTKTDFLI
jgi:Ni,Fe-hydrogenase I large subunit